MYAFTLERPTTTADALKLAAAGAQPLAGGGQL
jgi:aerobic carbon-monoxide dehydrogenase medium subunit